MRYTDHYKALTALGLPIIIGQLGIILVGLADTLMVGWYGTEELAAASFVNNMFNLCIIFATGFSYGLTPVVGALFGSNQQREAGQALRMSLLANLLIALLLMAAMTLLYLFVECLGQPVELLPLIKPYYLILLASLPFVLLFNAFKQFADGITDTRTGMWILLTGNALNIAGNYLLINGVWLFPELGLMGAGAATLLSRVLMVLLFAAVIAGGKRFAAYREGLLRSGWSLPLFKRLNALGWPVGLQMGMETASFSLTAIFVGWLGTTALASHQVMLTVGQFGFMMYYGMGAAVTVRASNFLGRGDIANVRRSAYAGFHLILCMALVMGTLLFLLRGRVGGWFTDDAEVSAMVASLIIPFLLYQFGDGLQITFANALRGIADVKPMMRYSFIAYFVVSLPAAYLFGFVMDGGLPGVWMSFPFGLTTAGVLFYTRFRKKCR